MNKNNLIKLGLIPVLFILIASIIYADKQPNLIEDSIEEGEIKTYNINGFDYKIALYTITETHVKFIVNEKLSADLTEGDYFVFYDGAVIYVNEIIDPTHSGTTGYLVKFQFKGAEKPVMDYDFREVLEIGEKNKYDVNGVNYEIEVVSIGSFNVKFKVNGKSTGNLLNREICELADGSKIQPITIVAYGSKDDYVRFAFKGVEKPTQPTHPKIFLSDYPNMMISDGKFVGTIVVGDKAPSKDVISATNIAIGIQFDTSSTAKTKTEIETTRIEVGTIKLSSEISSPYKIDVISVGNPCNNPTSSILMGHPPDCLIKHLKKGEGLIKLYNYNEHVQIVVAGYSDDDTRRAAEVLSNWKNYDLRGDEFIVTGSLAKPIIDVPSIPLPIKEEVPIEEEIEKALIQPSVPACNGCSKDNNCLPFGTRIVEKDIPKFCDISKTFKEQKEKGEACQNNYECKTNQCTDGECSSIKEELKETRSLLQKILNWIEKFFGK